MPDMQGSRGVSRDEFNLDVLPVTNRCASIAIARGQDFRNLLLEGTRGHEEINEAWSRDNGGSDLFRGREMADQALGQFSGVVPASPGEPQDNRACEVSVFAGPTTLDPDRWWGREINFAFLLYSSDGCLQQRLQMNSQKRYALRNEFY